MFNTTNTNPPEPGKAAGTISTNNIQNYLKWNCGAMDNAQIFEELIDFCNTVAGNDETLQPETISRFIWNLQQWRNLMLLTAIENGININAEIEKFLKHSFCFDEEHETQVP